MTGTLADYAAHPQKSRGRVHQEHHSAEVQLVNRNEFVRDRDRIIHSSAFRRLEYKTQVFINHEGDLFRTRLTHSIEVAQISRTVARALNLNEDLTEAISLAHDLGHTPFGHAGQDALDKCMRDYGGFEHNLQSLRVVDVLEEKYAHFDGLNLCYETREGILKHCTPARAAQLGELGQRFFDGSQPSLEAQLVNIADVIAYTNHDVDDGLRAGLIDMEGLRQVAFFANSYDLVKSEYPNIDARRLRYEIVRRMITCHVNDLVAQSRANLQAADLKSIHDVRNYRSQLISFSPQVRAQTRDLKRYLFDNLYRHYRVNRMVHKLGKMLARIFAAYMKNPHLLPPKYQQRCQQSLQEDHRARVIADYLAGMTDRYAIGEYERLFAPHALA